eukprot:gnl/MRDRNA2_/MRDRNA2_129415_c0_seq1.p1 gnl/MRDRNA2_/MRDRNA2_129415_c0~~gnl/MRDRNA2_/MRDRNA2_129415_c0_seq1.p1  ORF type:complete len:148 (-),score=15.41 gnl/MRDRNA2_/MRDRNA2_129415_c0_seq1:20-397(-)
MDNPGLSGSVSSSGSFGKPKEPRDRLLAGNEKLDRSSQELASAQRTALETENIGLDVMSRLQSQREQIIRTREHVSEVNQNVTGARRTLTSMRSRAMANKMVLIMVALVLFAGIVVALYIWFNKK